MEGGNVNLPSNKHVGINYLYEPSDLHFPLNLNIFKY